MQPNIRALEMSTRTHAPMPRHRQAVPMNGTNGNGYARTERMVAAGMAVAALVALAWLVAMVYVIASWSISS